MCSLYIVTIYPLNPLMHALKGIPQEKNKIKVRLSLSNKIKKI